MRIAETLTEAEQQDLEILELVVAQGIAAFYEVGMALREIRDRRLYRAQAGTFEQYLQRWQRRVGRRRAEQLMAAAETMESLGVEFGQRPEEMRTSGSHCENPPLPRNERQLRPLAGLPAAEQRAVWEDAAQSAGNEQPSGRQVEEARTRLEAARRRESTVLGAAHRLSPVPDERSRRLERVAEHLRQVRRHLEALGDQEGLARLLALEEWVEEMG